MDNKENKNECMWMLMGSIHESDRVTVAKCLDMMEEKDISKGGAKYNNYGFTSVSLANTVNSILNINKFVFGRAIICKESTKRTTIWI